jgi:hypothetical protein
LEVAHPWITGLTELLNQCQIKFTLQVKQSRLFILHIHPLKYKLLGIYFISPKFFLFRSEIVFRILPTGLMHINDAYGQIKNSQYAKCFENLLICQLSFFQQIMKIIARQYSRKEVLYRNGLFSVLKDPSQMIQMMVELISNLILWRELNEVISSFEEVT